MEQNIAVLIDFENIAAGTEKEGLGKFDVEVVLQRIKDKGRILISRSYADWGRFARFKQGLLTNNVTMMELTSHGMHDKNRADIALVVDALDLAFTKEYVDTYVIVSGDSDFTPLVLKMRELNKRVIGCGVRSSTSRLLIQACDEFVFYDQLVTSKRKERKTKRSDGKMSKADAFELLTDSLAGLLREEPTAPLASVVKGVMLRKSPDFSESDLGYSSFARFLEAAARGGHVALTKDRKAGGYRVDDAEAKEAEGLLVIEGDDDNGDDDGRPSGRKRRRGRGRSRDDDEAEVFLDSYLPDDTEAWVELLEQEGLNPLAAPTRKDVLAAVEEAVAYRQKKRRRISVQFVQEDLRRTLRKTQPELPGRMVKHVFNALMRAGVLMHKDGTPVRTGSAQFTLDKTADELNEALADIYLDTLHSAGADLSDIAKLAKLFYGDATNTRRLTETLAYMQANAAEEDAAADEDHGGNGESHAARGDSDDELEIGLDDLDDLDAMLEAEGDDERSKTATSAPSSEDATSEGKPKRKRRRRTKKADASKAEASDADGEAQAEEVAELPAEQRAPDDGEPLDEPTFDPDAADPEATVELEAGKKAGVLHQATGVSDDDLLSFDDAPPKDETEELPKKPKRRVTRRKRSSSKASDDGGDDS